MLRRLSKLLFPHLPPDQRKRRMDTLVMVAMVAGIIATVIAVVMFRVAGR